MSELIPFDEIVPGASVRVVTINGLQYLSIRDIIMCVCGKDNKRASEVWDRLSIDKKQEVSAFCGSYKFPGPGQSEQPVITFPGALKLIMFLPGETAKQHRSAMVNILRRYFAGDPTLFDEIESNAKSDSAVAQMARASLASEGAVLEDSPLKRKREELEIRKLEVETQYVSIDVGMEKYEAVCVNTKLDERAKHIFKEAILSLTTGKPSPVPAALAAPAPAAEKIPAAPKLRRVNSFAYIWQFVSTEIDNEQTATQYLLDYSQMVDEDLMVVTEPAGIDTKDITKIGTNGMWDLWRVIGISYTGPRVAMSRLRRLNFIKEAYGAEVSGVQFLVLVLFQKSRVLAERVLETVSKVVPLKLQAVSVYAPNHPTSDPILAAIKLPSANKWMFRVLDHGQAPFLLS
jgi:hypothetical protein